jgi:hypothetical protein
MFLKELLLRLNRTLWGQFLREIYPFKKMTPKVGRINTAITGKLLIRIEQHALFLSMGSIKFAGR